MLLSPVRLRTVVVHRWKNSGQMLVATLKARAEARGVSLSSFLRDLMANEAAMPPIDDVMAAIASREPVSYAAEDLRSFMEDGRR